MLAQVPLLLRGKDRCSLGCGYYQAREAIATLEARAQLAILLLAVARSGLTPHQVNEERMPSFREHG